MNELILVVDDLPDIAEIASRHLTSAGYRVEIAHDGAQALAAIDRELPDCICLDLMMPGMTGMELMQKLRHDPRLARVPVVLVSARIGQGRTHVFAERDATYCVGKPFTRTQLLAAIRSALADRAAIANAV